MARKIKGLSQDFTLATEQVFNENRFLSSALPDFVPRVSQKDLALAIARSIQNKGILLAEAGTGTGKTFAYLVPALLSGKKILVSTATKTLQDQLVQRDLPLLMRALKLGVTVQNLKGRANYLCEYRTKLFAEEGRFTHRETLATLLHIREKLSQLQEGVKEELPEIAESDPVWSYVTSTTENCLGSECPHIQTCFLVKARKRAMEAHLVVVNHHLFFADAKLKDDGFGALLGGMEVLIFDEAHQLPEIASDFYGIRLSTWMLADFLSDLLREWPSVSPAYQEIQKHTGALEALISLLRQASGEALGRFQLHEKLNIPVFKQAWEAWENAMQTLREGIEGSGLLSKDYPGIQRCYLRLQEIQERLAQFKDKETTQILWMDVLKHHVVFYATPVDIAPLFRNSLSQYVASVICTSATLTVAGSFETFSHALGFEKPETLLLASPFNYQEQALLYLPRGLPDPKSALYCEVMIERVLPIIEACKGRCFFLFTSYDALYDVADRLKALTPYPLLVQGSESKTVLLARFRTLGNAILLGTATFWEGVDVKGEALSCVIIDKLPFMSPQDPLTKGKLAHFASLGCSGFNQYTLPEAVLALKQGVGRLIRDQDDTGIIVIVDPRLTAREYGKVIFESLPPMLKTRDEQKALKFIQKKVNHEDNDGISV